MEQPQPGPSRPTVVVTGASSGIGEATAKLLAAEGYHVLAGVRCARTCDAWTAARTENVTPIRLDVTCPDQVASAVEQVSRANPDGLFALINNAGVGAPSAVELS
ncbi:MAG: SDR family NAD(P)-dependent oxidoreductase, partial [Planctomycetota bacterium]